ncbi:MAG: DNA replication complex GINS family protein [Thaumarchaeota archaeon]|nr:DNA replication complex GINS family protein [Nitrososphaerota archaeon]
MVIVEGFKQALKMVEVEFENSLEEVLVLKDIQKLNLPSGAVENLKAGSSLRVYHWVAERLFEKEIAKPAEDLLDMKTILQLRWKEKSEPAELQPLPSYFYLRVREAVSRGDSDLLPHLRDIFSLRLAKMMSFAAKRIPASMIENLTAEEKVFYEHLLSMVNAWYEFIEVKKG